jgi:hypothetical protein
MALTKSQIDLLCSSLKSSTSPSGRGLSPAGGTLSELPASVPHHLDTSPVNGLISDSPLNKLKKRAHKYSISKRIIYGQLQANPRGITKGLQRALKCGYQVLIKDDGRTESRYCGTRFCSVCNGIRTNKLVNKLSPVMEGRKWWMVVLSCQNVPEHELRAEIERYKDTLSRIDKHFKNNKCKKGNGFYVFEITYNLKTNTYHPHIHMMVDNDVTADLILSLWLKYNQPKKVRYHALRDRGNKVTPFDESKGKGIVVEMVKYLTKVVKVDKEAKQINANCRALNVAYNALNGLRIYQSFGDLRNIAEPTDEEIIQELNALETDLTPGIYTWKGMDWINEETGEVLTNHINKWRVYDNGTLIAKTNAQTHLEKLLLWSNDG